MGPAGFAGGAIIAASVYVVASATFGESKLPVDESKIGVPEARETLHSSGSVQSIQKETRIKEEPRVVEKDVE